MNAAMPSDPNSHALPLVDFAAFGEVEVTPLTRVQKFAAGVLTRSWTGIPHVTHHDEADVTALEAVRSELAARESQRKVSLLVFLIRAAVAALKAHPKLNSSLDASGANLVLKRYFNIGVAIDTPSGLLVAVIRDCERKGVSQIASELARLSRRAREKGLTVEEMSGGCFTVSSLGGIGGTAFTPIINAPEVAVLGVSKTQWKPIRDADDRVAWRLMLPLSLSYDHRVVNGADAARFMRSLADALIASPVI
jgi:pyruvate dehydrogenase E2 component (dihydrolipoamide acetyltransferase)